MTTSTIPHQPTSIPEMFSRRLESDPGRIFLEVPDGTGWTFRQIERLVAELAGRLRDHGVERGDVVALYQWNEPSWFTSVLAVWRLGGVAALCGAVSPSAEAVNRLTLVRPKVVISCDAPDLSDAWPVIQVDRAGALLDADGRSSEPFLEGPTLDAEDPACIFFTSGTTGQPKAVIKRHGKLTAGPRATASAYSSTGDFRPRVAPADKAPTASFNPFGQVASFGRLIFRLHVGRSLILVRKFTVDTVKQLTSKYAFDTLQLTPAMVHMLAFTEENLDLSSLRYVNSGTAPLPTATRVRFEDRYGVPVLQAYGSTEGGVTALETLEDVLAGRRGPGSVGRITATSKWRIVDPTGADVKTGEVGEIVGQPSERTVLTANGQESLPLDEAGWYHTGDLGRVDEHGILYITGRIKEMLIVGGFNVYPVEVEEALRTFPGVRDAVVVGLADDRLGEVPVAGLLWDAEHGPATTVELTALSAHLREQLAAYKVPRRWFNVEEVPLTPLGKVDRAAARTLAECAKEANGF